MIKIVLCCGSSFAVVSIITVLTLSTKRTNTHTHIRLRALCPGLPGWASTKEVKPIWIFTEARDSEWRCHQLGHMPVCTSLQTDNHANTPPLSFTGRMPFLLPNQQRQSTEGHKYKTKWMNYKTGVFLIVRRFDRQKVWLLGASNISSWWWVLINAEPSDYRYRIKRTLSQTNRLYCFLNRPQETPAD